MRTEIRNYDLFYIYGSSSTSWLFEARSHTISEFEAVVVYFRDFILSDQFQPRVDFSCLFFDKKCLFHVHDKVDQKQSPFLYYNLINMHQLTIINYQNQSSSNSPVNGVVQRRRYKDYRTNWTLCVVI